ncbi:MAG: RNA polymerase sigma factor [Muribaculaceae bacterium]
MTTESFFNNLMGIRPRLLSFAYRLTANYDDANDLLQDTTLKILCNEKKFVEENNFKGWAMTIMKNIFINNYRKESKLIVINDSTDNTGFIDATKDKATSDTPDSVMSQKEIMQMVNHLPGNIRATFGLYLKGYAYQEIADIQDLPIGTVKSRIFIAKKRLQKNLADFR